MVTAVATKKGRATKTWAIITALGGEGDGDSCLVEVGADHAFASPEEEQSEAGDDRGENHRGVDDGVEDRPEAVHPRAVEHFGEHERQGSTEEAADKGGCGGRAEREVGSPENLRGKDGTQLTPGNINEKPEERTCNEENTQSCRDGGRAGEQMRKASLGRCALGGWWAR